MLNRSLFAILILLLSASLAFAVDDEGNENDPVTNDRANACYEDGTMANRCQTELDWQAGWYLIRYEYGIYTRDDIPGWVAWILPPEVVPEELGSGSLCIQAGTSPTPYVDFTGSNYAPAGTTIYASSDCTGTTGNSVVPLVYAPAGVDASAICSSHGFSTATPHFGDVYACF